MTGKIEERERGWRREKRRDIGEKRGDRGEKEKRERGRGGRGERKGKI